MKSRTRIIEKLANNSKREKEEQSEISLQI